MVILGIDPGIHGALALVRGQDLLAVADMPIEATGSGGHTKHRLRAVGLAHLVRQYQADYPSELLAVVERVQAMPSQGVSSTFAFGFSAGVIHGVLQALHLRIEYVAPTAWKRHMRLGADKGHARAMASQRWPQHAAQFSRVRDDGRAEAALIAAYGWERYA